MRRTPWKTSSPTRGIGRMRSPLIEAACVCQLSLDAAGRSGAENMAIDAALLDRANGEGLSFLRLYRFDPPCLSLGRTEPAAAFGSLRHAYHTIHERIAAALRSLGADATLAPHQPPPASRVDQPTSCFATPVGGEVLVAGRKLVGSAQVRKGNAFLQHGSILLDGSQEIVAAVSRKPQVARTVTTLSAELGRRVTWDEVVEAVVQAWRDEGTSPNLHQPPPTSTTLHFDLAPLGIAVKS